MKLYKFTKEEFTRKELDLIIGSMKQVISNMDDFKFAEDSTPGKEKINLINLAESIIKKCNTNLLITPPINIAE